jgi:preprotein translocase subunit YajC
MVFMQILADRFLLLAQAAADAEGNGPQGISKLFEGPWVLMFLVTMMLYFMVLRPQRKDQTTRVAMLSSLKKNDTVLTSAGIFGKVVQANEGSDEITIRIDENANTRMRILRSSVVQVVAGDGSKADPTTAN